MPVVGSRKSSSQMGRGYSKDPLHGLAASFANLANNILNESAVDVFMEPAKAMMIESANDAMQNFFVENSSVDQPFISPEDYQDHMDMMVEQYRNDRDAILEYAPASVFNPVIGITYPIHKNILMNNVFDKALPKAVAQAPKFTLTMETRILKTPDGEEIDMFTDQNKILAAMESVVPFKEIVLALPELEATDVLGLFNANVLDDNISIETYVSGIVASTYCKSGDVVNVVDTTVTPNTIKEETVTADGMKDIVFRVKKEFHPGYGEYDRQIMDQFNIVTTTDADGNSKIVKGVLSGYMQKNKFCIQSSNPDVTKIVLSARIDASNAMVRTCSVSWKARTDMVEIPDATPINVPVSPDEIKDVGALYQTNQLTKIMSLIKLVMGNYKDDKIRKHLDNSFITMPDSNKLARTFDFAPREGYALDHVEWRRNTFMDALDTYVTLMLQVLNDPNMTISVIGRPDIIRKITPAEYTYQLPSAVGPIELDFVKTVVTSDKRVYQFISSDKLRDTNNLIVVLCPRNTERIVYRIYDYQLYVSNEIRNATTYSLPAIHAFERWKFVEYQPVQGRVKILNPSGLRTYVENDTPVTGNAAKNDFNIDFEGSQKVTLP